MSRVILNKSAIKGIERKALDCLGITAEVLQDEIREAQVIPRDTGNLQNEGFVVDTSAQQRGTVRLRFTPPYARRLYYHLSHVKNPNSQGLWLKSWMKGGQYEKRPAQIFEELLKRRV